MSGIGGRTQLQTARTDPWAGTGGPSAHSGRGRHHRAARSHRRGRRVAGLLRFVIFLLLIFVAVWAGVRVAHASADGSVYTGHRVTVGAGDTLWSLASEEYGPAVDLRQAVYEIRQANGLSGSALLPGQRLTLPYVGP